MNSTLPQRPLTQAFTLIELLVVISIIAILAGLLLPVISSVQTKANVVQAKSEEQQLIAGVKSFWTDYGNPPVPAADIPGPGQYTFGEDSLYSADLISILQATTTFPNGNANPADATLVPQVNPKMVHYLDWKVATSKGKTGLGNVQYKGGLGPTDGQPYDPWGRVYIVRMDIAGNGYVPNIYYPPSAGSDPIRLPVIVWSAGPDGQLEALGVAKTFRHAADDVISWQ